MPLDLASTPEPLGVPMPRLRLDLSGRAVLFASDGSPESHAAAGVAYELAKHRHADLHVLRVIDTRSAPMPPGLDLAIGIADAAVGPSVHAEQINAVRAELSSAIGEQVDWKVRVALGAPARVIVQEARRLRAALVVMGLRRHGRFGRALQDETTLQVMRRAGCPVLGVAAAAAPPSKVLAAVDFSRASMAAARVARAVMADEGTIVLAYVPPVTFDLPDDGEAVIHSLGVAAGFAQMRAALGGDGITTDQVVLHRVETTPAAALLLEYAEQAQCDLIAAGSARRGRLDRWMLGSVSTDLVRDGRRSVLIVPARRRKPGTTPAP